ncbi:cytosine deaminase [Fructobacillus papyrifericola]|uniref:Cytosine deaminase n=1 Tax=Fructobacillus papyrifericola TaxID=2713172 RepID=A0ABS5QVK3_9LACO|nr:cytosine deaminase [Fructobacillus papyrifericola]MBS9335952.1 cytosine deaminase [Fructobacillus papyrifericola]
MIIQNAHIENAKETTDFRIEGGRIVEMAAHLPVKGEEVLDLQGKLVLPPFVDSHIHLDSTLTAGQPEWNESGTLFDGIRIWSERKKSLSIADVKERAIQTLKKQASHGVQFVRSHVDVTDPSLTALKALLEVREEVKDFMDLQLIAFPQEGILSFPNGKELMEKAVLMGVDGVGGIPHYEFNRQYGDDSIDFLVDLAKRYDRLVDVHCDEIDDPNSRHLEVLTTLAYESGLKNKVTASHTVSLGSVNDAYAYKLMRVLKMADINMVANPLVNMHLGGRFDTYPKRRGMTRVKELLENQINVSFGEDDVKDPWYPMGDGNMLDSLYVGILSAGLMGYSQIQSSYQLIGQNGAKSLHREENYGLAVGKDASFLVFDAENFYDVLNERRTMLYSFRKGVCLIENKPMQTFSHLEK